MYHPMPGGRGERPRYEERVNKLVIFGQRQIRAEPVSLFVLVNPLSHTVTFPLIRENLWWFYKIGVGIETQERLKAIAVKHSQIRKPIMTKHWVINAYYWGIKV